MEGVADRETRPMETNTEWARLVASGFFADYSYEARRRYQKSANAIDCNRTAWIVEVGCGTGRYHKLLKEMGYTNLISCDLTLEHIWRAKEVDPHGLFVVASGERMPFRDGVFDCLVSNAAIEHFANPAKGVSEFSRVTANDAKLVITSDCYSWRVLQLFNLYRSKMPIDRTMAYSQFRRLFRSGNLEIVDADAWGVTHYLRQLSRRFAPFSKLLDGAMRDDHWSNLKPQSRFGLMARMFLLDENLFVLRKLGSEGAPLAGVRPEIAMRDILACPICRGALAQSSHSVECLRCQKSYPVVDGILNFL